MPAPREFLSCDWGTSSFRLRHIVRGEIKSEIRESTGIKSIYEESLRQGGSRAARFEDFMCAKMKQIGGSNLPLIISGMASSTIGWKELPYAKTPFRLDGAGLHVERIEWSGPETTLVSGVATGDDVMRGEETQIVGLMRLPRLTQFAQRSVLILPGTHSKHVRIENESVTDFRTHMTGELFEVLGRHSILRASVNVESSIRDMHSFELGVARAFKEGLGASLFSVRARAVLEGIAPSDNTAYLSGLLIGSEVAKLRESSEPILIAASGALAELYATALESANCVTLSSQEVDQATVTAHALILARQ